MRNLGVIIEKKPKDFAAAELPYEVLNPSGDWTPYLPSPENQFTHHTDSQACVTFSCLNIIETQYKFLTGREINFSDRFIAKLSGTTQQGNSVQRVLDAINTYGLVLESDWPTDYEFNWDQYYAPIPQSVINKADKSYKVLYGFHSPADDLNKEMKHVPLEIIIEATNPYHSVMKVNKTQQFDHYLPNLRPIKSIHIATKIILKGVKNSMNLINDNGTYYLAGEKGKLGIADPESLKLLKQLTDAEQTGSSSAPQVGIIEKGFTIHK